MGFDWKDIGKTVAKVAPVLGSVLGGPVGMIAGAAGALLGNFLGVEATPDAVEQALSANPEALLRLKEMEFQHQETLIAWQRDQVNADLENLKSAREREVSLSQAGDRVGAWATHVVSTIVTVGFFITLYVVLGGKVSTENQAALLLLGTMSAGFGAVVQYYLGSSLGSKVKTDALTSAVKK